MAAALPLMRNVLTPFAKSVLVPVHLIVEASATDQLFRKKIMVQELIISIEEINDIMKIIKCFQDTGLLIKFVSKTLENEVKNQKGGFLCVPAATLGASLLESMLSDKGMIGAGKGVKGRCRVEAIIREQPKIFNDTLSFN